MKKEYKYLLWDVDDTLVDFGISEKMALKKCFAEHGIVLTEEEIAVYSNINVNYWKQLEQGKIEKEIMLVRRFDDFIHYLSADGVGGEAINKKFQISIGDHAVMYEGAYEICHQLQGIKKQYAITNGTAIAQERKLRNTGLDKIFDGIFISDVIGHQKPSIQFFQCALEQIPNFSAEKALVIGDSLTSDMKGANNVGIDCCWFNPKGASCLDTSIKIDYEIKSLEELLEII